MSTESSLHGFLSFGGGALGLLGISATLYAIGSIRAVRARCIGVEASLAAVRRELELMTSIRGDPRTLAARFGLSPAEAELVARLHGHKEIA